MKDWFKGVIPYPIIISEVSTNAIEVMGTERLCFFSLTPALKRIMK